MRPGALRASRSLAQYRYLRELRLVPFSPSAFLAEPASGAARRSNMRPASGVVKRKNYHILCLFFRADAIYPVWRQSRLKVTRRRAPTPRDGNTSKINRLESPDSALPEVEPRRPLAVARVSAIA